MSFISCAPPCNECRLVYPPAGFCHAFARFDEGVVYLLGVLHLREELGGAGFGDGTEIIDEVVARHTDAGIDDV